VEKPFSPPPPTYIPAPRKLKSTKMNLIHIADTHLGLAAFNRLDPESGMNLREKQVFDNFLKAIDEIILQKPDVLVHADDLFDVVKPKTRAY